MALDALSAIKKHYQQGGLQNVHRVVCNHFTDKYPFIIAKLRHYRRYIQAGESFHPFAIYLVKTSVIHRYVEWNVFKNFSNATRVRPGNWDLDAKPLHSLGKYRLLHQYLMGHLTGEELTYERLREYGYADSEATLYAQYGYAKYIEQLCKSITNNSIRIHPPSTGRSPFEKYDRIALDIARDGELLFDGNGCHRLAISGVFDIERIPVRINAIHEEWYNANGDPRSHAELTYLTQIPIPWRDLYTLETSSTTLPTFY